jgi:hypothetical protein
VVADVVGDEIGEASHADHCVPFCLLPPLTRQQVMVLGLDKDRGRVTLSTKKLEAVEGDMLRDPQAVSSAHQAVLWLGVRVMCVVTAPRKNLPAPKTTRL